MSCFDVKILEPDINTIEIETCIGDQPSSISIITFDNTSILEINNCVALLPSEINDYITVKDIIAGSGIAVISTSGIYTISLSDTNLTSSDISDFLESVQDIIGQSGLSAGNYVNLIYNDTTGLTTISITGVQPSGNYSLVGHTHVTNDITNFSSGVSGLLPSVTGAGYATSNFANNVYTISVTGVQPSGNYSLVGHTHVAEDITDFNIAVSGLIPVTSVNNQTGDVYIDTNIQVWDEEVAYILVNQVVLYNDTLYRVRMASQGENPASSPNSWSIINGSVSNILGGSNISIATSGSVFTISATGLQPSGNYSIVGHNHISTDITDFNSAVSGLIPPSNFTSLIGVSGVTVSNSGTNYTVSLTDPTIQLIDITDLSSNARSFLLTPSSSNLSSLITDKTGSGILVFNNSPSLSGVPTAPTAPSGTNNTQIANTAFVRTEISNLINSAPSTLDTLNELAAALGNDPNFATTVTNSLASKAALSGAVFTGSVTIPSGTGNFNILTVNNTGVSLVGHTHSSSDITNFNSSVSGLLPSVSGSGYVNSSFNNNTYTISVTGLQPSGNYSIVGHNHISTDITDFNSAVSGLLPVKDIVAGTGIGVTSNNGIYTINSSSTITADTLEPDGFVNRTDSIISFNNGSRQFSIAPKSPATSYAIYNNGTKVIKTNTESIILPNSTALYFIYFAKNNNALSSKTTPFNFDTDIPIAQVYYNSNDGKAVYFGEERHGIRMDAATHRYLHNVFGTQYINGLSISNYTITGNGSNNSDATIAIGDGLIYDEDIEANISHSNTPTNPFEQILNPIAQIPVYYKLGSNGVWTNTTANNYPVKTGTTIQYNLLTGSTWTIENSPNPNNDRFIAYWICATTQENAPIISIMGQRIDSSLEQATSNNSWGDLNLNGLPIVELRPLYRLIYNTKNLLINQPKGFLVDVLDIRGHIDTVTGLTQNDHGSLYGLGDDDHYQYVHIDNARTIDAIHTFSNGLNASGLINAASGNFTSLTVNNTGVSLIGHTHTSSDITNFNSAVSGLLPTISNSGDNRLLTSTGTSTGINAESNATFNGTTLAVSGVIVVDNLQLDGNTLSSINNNGNIIIQPSGTGAIQRDSDGDTRGQYAIDWQTSRNNNTRVASGNYSVIGGGSNNIASGIGSTINGGQNNNANGDNSTIGGGQSNTASNIFGTVCGGQSNNASGGYSTIGGGFYNTSSNYYSTIGGGQSNTCSGYWAVIGGGYYNSNTSFYGTIGGGFNNTCNGDGASTISGGQFNTTNSRNTTISGGEDNNCDGEWSVIGGGWANNTTGNTATIGGGKGNTISSNFSTIAGGNTNTITGFLYSSIGGGAFNSINTNNAGTISGGIDNLITAEYCSIIGGRSAKSSKYGEVSHSAGSFANKGDSQHSILILRTSTTNSTLVTLTLDGFGPSPSNRMFLPPQTSWSFSIKVSAYNSTDNQAAWWIIRGGIRRNAANQTSLVGSLITENGAESSLSSASVSVVADDTNEALEIQVTGITSKTIRWTAVVDISQVSFGTP